MNKTCVCMRHHSIMDTWGTCIHSSPLLHQRTGLLPRIHISQTHVPTILSYVEPLSYMHIDFKNNCHPCCQGYKEASRSADDETKGRRVSLYKSEKMTGTRAKSMSQTSYLNGVFPLHFKTEP